LIGKFEGKRQLGRSRHIWEDNIKMDLRGMGWEGWIGGQMVGACEHGN
jgi:hypothetical protein